MNRTISIILGLLSCLTVFSQTAQIDSLKKELEKTTEPADSLIILFNIFDLTHTDESTPLLEEIYSLALRQKKYDSVNSALALLSSFNSQNDSMQEALIKRASDLPPYDVNRAALLYLKARNANITTKRMSNAEKQEKLLKYLSEYRERDWSNADIYEQVESLFMLVNYLSEATNGDMLTEYLLELQELTKKIDNLYILSLFNSIASQTFIDNDMFEAAAQANRDKLSLIEKFDNTPESKLRPYHSHDGMLFNTYLSLLMCHEVLSEEELDEYYNNMVRIEKAKPASRFSKTHMRRAAIYYLIGKKKYAEALPLIKEQLEETNPESERRRLLSLLIEAAKAENDKATLLVALDEHNTMLKQHIADKADANYKELQILYDVQKLKELNANLIHDNQIITIERQRAITFATIIGLVLVVVILIFLWRSYSRAHRLSKDLSSSNKILATERDNLKDTQRDLIKACDKAKAAERDRADFVMSLNHEIRTPLNNIIEYSNLISDSVTGDTAPYIKRFAEIVTRNSELLNTLANDILDGSSLENSSMKVRVVPSSAKDICQHALRNVEKSLKPDIKLVFTNIDDPDVIFNSDPYRVEQILRNLLDNALKFTRKGIVKLSYRTDPNRRSLIFSVTDTGSGIPTGKEEEIFERFTKLNPQVPGNGLGLYIARMLAQLLNGALTLDNDYRTGARFLLEIPLSA